MTQFSQVTDISNELCLDVSEAREAINALNNMKDEIMHNSKIPEYIKKSLDISEIKGAERERLVRRVRRMKSSMFEYSLNRMNDFSLKECIKSVVESGLMSYEFDKDNKCFIYDHGTIGGGLHNVLDIMVNKDNYNGGSVARNIERAMVDTHNKRVTLRHKFTMTMREMTSINASNYQDNEYYRCLARSFIALSMVDITCKDVESMDKLESVLNEILKDINAVESGSIGQS